jgi:hypothetical protein
MKPWKGWGIRTHDYQTEVTLQQEVLSRSGSTIVAAPGLPKLASLPVTAAQSSTANTSVPVGAGRCRALFSRSQSTTLSLSRSCSSG